MATVPGIFPNADVILARLSLVDGTSGSIVAVGAWIALHAGAAEEIFAQWAKLISNPESDDATRIGLLHLVHEVILSCQNRSIGDAGIKSLLTAMAKRCPGAFAAAAAKAGNEFKAKLAQVLQWWTVMKVFPPTLLKELKTNILGDEVYLPVAGGQQGATASKDLQPLLKLHAKYTTAKERHRIATQSGDEDAIASAEEDLVRRLISLIKHIDGGATDSGSLLGKLRTELDDLRSGLGVVDNSSNGQSGVGGAGTGSGTQDGIGATDTGAVSAMTAIADPLADFFE